MRDPGGVAATDSSEVLYAGIPPSGAVTVEQELEWRARHLGSELIVDSYADLEFHYPADGGGVHHATGNVRQTGTVVLPVGNEIDQGTTGSWRCNFASQTQIVGSSTGAVMRGNPLRAQNVGWVQLDPAGECVIASSSIDPTKTIVVRQCIFAGAGGAGTFSNFQGPVTIEDCQIASQRGLVFTGVASLARFVDCVGSGTSMAVGAVMFTVDAAAVVLGGYLWDGCSMITGDSTQRMIRIDPAATVPGNAAGLTTDVGMRAIGNQITALASANLGRVFDETGMAEEDQRVWARASLYGDDSLMFGQGEFLVADVAPTPIQKTYSLANTFEDIPRDNGGAGVGNEILLDAVSQRFDLIQDGPTGWYLRKNGPLPAGAGVSWTCSLEASPTSSTIKLQAEWRQGAADPWKPVPGSTSIRAQINNTPGFVGGSGRVPLTSSDAHFKVTISNDNAAASTNILALSIFVS